MKEENQQRKSESSCHILARRRSVPEEIIRKFSVTSERTSESETNATMPEITPPSSKENEELLDKGNPSKNDYCGSDKLRANVFSKKIDTDIYTPVVNRSFRLVHDSDIVHSAEEGSSDSDSDAPGMERFNTIKRAPLRRGSVIEGTIEETSESVANFAERVSQNDYYRNGQGILKFGVVEKSSQTGECICPSPHEDSGTTPSAREESESAESSETISSPRMCAQPLSSSDNQSSDSEGIKCTCAEMTSSKDTSTDPNHSGKSTLSQTVSDKSTSTQDSTASINSVSSQGSSMSAATDSSSTDVDPRTSAKETTSPDHTPRSPPGRRRQDRDRDRSGNGGRGGDRRFCPQHKPARNRDTTRNNGAPKGSKNQATQAQIEFEPTSKVETSAITTPLVSHTYEWAQLSEEELCLIQQQRHQRFIENNRNFEFPVSSQKGTVPGRVSVCTSTGSSYRETENLEEVPLMVPRYSALPRTMSMVVNSSFEASQCSDSDCQSLADSLEDGHNPHEPLYDTMKERKPVRGDVEQALVERNRKVKKKEPRGRAYFFAIDSDGGAELVTNIHKIPELPEEIKNKIHERHVSICKNHESKQLTKDIQKNTTKGRHRLIKRKTKASQAFVAPIHASTPPTVRLTDIKSQNSELAKHLTPIKKRAQDQQIKKDGVSSHFISKIPTPVFSNPVVLERKDVKVPGSETVLASRQNEKRIEIRQDNEAQNNTADKPQAVIHPSLATFPGPVHSSSSSHQVPLSQSSSTSPKLPAIDLEAVTRHRLSLISSLESTASTLKAQKATQRQWNRPQPATKRTTKFQQRFEVIPEERSSSLTSSAEDFRSEKNRRRSLPVKLTEPATTTFLSGSGTGENDVKSFRRYTLGSLSSHVIAKLMGRPLQAIPCVQRGPNNENQEIIIFSPKDPPGPNNSSKGRDALLAMNREDFNRLSKGWMNFYLLKESSDSDHAQEDCDGPTNDSENALEVESEKVNQTENENKCLEANTIVCRIPSMEKDPPTTSGSGTDEACLSPGRCPHPSPFQLNAAQLNKSYSLLLKNPETNCFQLQECPTEPEETENTIRTLKAKTSGSELNYITEEPEPEEIQSEQTIFRYTRETSGSIGQRDASTKVDETLQNQNEKPAPKIETKEASTSTEKKYETKSKRTAEPPIRLSAPLKLSSSNTVLTTKKPKVSPSKTPKSSGRSCSLPELRVDEPKRLTPVKTQSLVDTLPRVVDASSGSEDTDSDSTVYLNAPSPQLPRLPLEGKHAINFLIS